jgi:hypothetical protein
MEARDIPFFEPSASVRLIDTEDGAALLDIQQGLCLSLTSIAAEIWQLLKLKRSAQEIAKVLAAEFPCTPHKTIQRDVAKCIQDFRRNWLLLTPEESEQKGHVPGILTAFHSSRGKLKVSDKSGKVSDTSLIFRALIGLLLFDLLSGRAAFTRIHAAVAAWPTAAVPSAADSVHGVCRAVNYACVWYPKRVLCLQRSAVTVCLLRNCGVQAKMVIGAQRCPFKAHAWTEVAGHPVNERTDVQRKYLVWERC